MDNVSMAKKLLEWNNRYLTASSDLTKDKIADLFGKSFRVRANGRNYDANYDNYFDFLNRFRSNIKSINYHFENFIVDKENVVIPLTAYIVRIDNSEEVFDAILILKFNDEHKIILWHEVYIKL